VINSLIREVKAKTRKQPSRPWIEVKITTHKIIDMIHRAGFEAVERDTVYNRVEKVGV